MSQQTTNAAAVPHWDGKGTAQQLLSFQRLAQNAMVLSMTRRCPLSCAHCITESHPDYAGEVLSPSLAEKWAIELPDLAAAGLRHLTFTGGEPVLAKKSVAILAEAAHRSGIRTALVTGGGWVTSTKTAVNVVRTLRNIDHWDIGYDHFHASKNGWNQLSMLVEALDAEKVSYSVRVCVNHEDLSVLKTVRALAPGASTVMSQPVKFAGRAKEGGDVQDLSIIGASPTQPCMSSGPLIHETGRAAPCCSILAYQRQVQLPFDHGDATSSEGSLLQVWQHWRADQLLRTMRLLGIQWPIAWAKEIGLLPESFQTSDDVCETCSRFWQQLDGNIDLFREHISDLNLKLILNQVERILFDATTASSDFAES